MRPQRNTQSLSEMVYKNLRIRILSGQIPLGTPLSRRQVASEFGVSIVPVGEALQRLQTEELVESRPRVGTRVRIPAADDVRGYYTVREALETHSARLFAEKASRAEKEEIAGLAAWLDKEYTRAGKGKLTAEEIYELHQRHLRFHMRVAECTGCRALAQAMERNHVLTLNWLYDTAADWHQLPPRFHASLAEALAAGDPFQASEAMRSHVTFGREELLEKLDKRLRHMEVMTA
ncbi:MAG: GntR family transcriptional regulator [Acidobacteria bacterium]|nr:GntR family transcriptional regulator [Acidobacteriota bacterium]